MAYTYSGLCLCRIPTGPSTRQPATNAQKDFVEKLGMGDQIADDLTKGDARFVLVLTSLALPPDIFVLNIPCLSDSQMISKGLAEQKSQPSGHAAQDESPGTKIPTG